MASTKLKITAAGWETFTGHLCGASFTNAVSDTVLVRNQIDRISAIVKCELIDDAGNAAGQAGANARSVGSNQIEAITESLPVMTDAELVAERKAAMDRMLKNPASKIYTEAELEGLGAQQGIKGVREIGDKWGVKERALGKLIFLILQAQSEYLAKVKERDADIAVKIQAATAESLAKIEARRVEFDAKARVYSDATANSIAGNGAAVFVDPNARPAIDPSLQKHPHHIVLAGNLSVEVTEAAQAAVATALNLSPADKAKAT